MPDDHPKSLLERIAESESLAVRKADAEVISLIQKGLIAIKDGIATLTPAGRYCINNPPSEDTPLPLPEAPNTVAGHRGAPPLKNTDADRAVTDAAYAVTADELRQFIERAEQLAAEKKDVAEQEKALFAEAKGRGYDTKIMKKVIALRKRKPDEIAEEEAKLDLYKSALGMI